jgi:branched-chain amino acid aminotransferase
MAFDYFSRNGELLPISDANVSIGDVAYSYGFGVYETIRLQNSIPYFVEQHLDRLLESARLLQIEHRFLPDDIVKYILAVVAMNKVEHANLKILLIGSDTPEAATLFIQVLNPLYPERKWYKTGVHCSTYSYERFMPHAKSLNMLQSYLAYREARKVHAYDALLINSKQEITEGSRTNFFGIKGKKIISPPENQILLGVMRTVVMSVARSYGFTIVERPIHIESLTDLDGAFLTSTSSKVMPIRSINEHLFESIPKQLGELIDCVHTFLDGSAGILS